MEMCDLRRQHVFRAKCKRDFKVVGKKRRLRCNTTYKRTYINYGGEIICLVVYYAYGIYTNDKKNHFILF